MPSFVAEALGSPRLQLLATAAVSGAAVAAVILGYQALEREERLSQLKRSIPPQAGAAEVSDARVWPGLG